MLLDGFRHMFQRGSMQKSPRSPPLDQSVLSVINALAVEQIARDAYDQAKANTAAVLRQWATRPVQLILSVNGVEMTTPTVVDVNDVSFAVKVAYARDAAGEHLEDAGPFTWSVDPVGAAQVSGGNPDGASVNIAVNPADASGAQQDFTLTATDANGISGSLACHPIAGGPTSLVLGVV